MLYLSIDNQDGRIVGWSRGPAMPNPSVDTDFVEIGENDLATLNEIQARHRESGRVPVIRWRNGVFTEDADERPVFRVEVCNTMPMADEPIAVTVTHVASDGTTLPLEGRQIFRVEDRNLAFDFIGGVASRQVIFSRSADWIIRSVPEYRVENPLTIRVVE